MAVSVIIMSVLVRSDHSNDNDTSDLENCWCNQRCRYVYHVIQTQTQVKVFLNNMHPRLYKSMETLHTCKTLGFGALTMT